MTSVISKSNAEHYPWGEACDAWYLLKNEQLTIIEERMPPGSSERCHQHTRSCQFFFVLAGSATMEHAGMITAVPAGSGLEIPPGTPHRISNNGDTDLEFIVTSMPPSHDDRVDLEC